MSHRIQILVLAAVLTAVALFVRVYRLDELGFYADEETTAFPARSVAEGGEAAMPSGMASRSALFTTYAHAAWARALGTDSELPYRMTAALLGALTIPFVFLASRRWIGTTAAMLAALLFAFSVLQLSHSREARMYSAYALFFTITGFASWRWAETGRWRDFTWLALAFLGTSMTHHGAVLAAPLVVVPIAFRRGTKVHPLFHIAAAVGLVACEYGYHLWVKQPYDQWLLNPAAASSVRMEPMAAFVQGSMNIALVAVGAVVGIIAAWRARPSDDTDPGAWLRVMARAILAACAGGLAFGGQAFGAGCALVLFLLIHDSDRRRLWRRTWPFAVACAVVMLGRIGAAVASQGLSAGLRSGFQWPYPTAIWFGQAFPGVYALLMAGVAWLAFRRPREETNFLRYCAIAFFIPVLVVGADHRYAPLRYVVGSYTFLVIIASVVLVTVLRRLVRREVVVGAIGALIVLSGVLGGHGVLQTWRVVDLDYGDSLDEQTFGYRFYPDHKTPGEYVRAHRLPSDRVVAEDPLTQHWYAGPITYWMRDFESNRTFMYRDKEGVIRDIYVASRAMPDSDLYLLAPRTKSRVWVITSAETSYRREMFLSRAQRKWMHNVEQRHKPVFEGRDGATRVYLLEVER